MTPCPIQHALCKTLVVSCPLSVEKQTLQLKLRRVMHLPSLRSCDSLKVLKYVVCSTMPCFAQGCKWILLFLKINSECACVCVCVGFHITSGNLFSVLWSWLVLNIGITNPPATKLFISQSTQPNRAD